MSIEVRTREDVEAEVARLRAGEDDTRHEPGTTLTPGQWLRRFNELSADNRLVWVKQVLDNADAAERCRVLDHAALRRELDAANDRIRALMDDRASQ